MSKKSHHFLTLWPWPLTYDLEKLIRSGHYHYQCVYQIWEQSILWFLSYRVNTIAGGGQRAAGDGRLRRKTITSPDPSDTGDIIITLPSDVIMGQQSWFNTLRPRRNEQHFTDAIFKRIFFNENVWISIKISLNKGPVNNIAALVQIMAWRRSGDKPISESMMVSSPMHICVTRPQWVNSSSPGQNGHQFADDIFKCIFMNKDVWILINIALKFVPEGQINNITILIQILAWHQPGDKPLSESMMFRLLTHICVTRPQWVKYSLGYPSFVRHTRY